MFDYAAPKQFPPNEKKRGVGQHPHRGFETVTLAFQGEVEHRDSTGNQDVIGPGDIQWMTAGRGIIHEEYHSTEFAKSGGIFEMCQLWVNLPAKHKMSKPGYQPILQSHVPTVFLPIGTTKDSDESSIVATVRVIAGELNGVKGPAKTFSPVELWDMQVPKKDSVVEVPVKEGHNCIAFVRRGGMEVLTNEGNQKVGPQAVALMERSGTHLKFRTTSADTSILIMGGEPIDEPIAARGPFVMNTHDEIMQANRDFQSGRMGQ
jgi:redox-sensitive bicupin YhaK (pirin superfamily)